MSETGARGLKRSVGASDGETPASKRCKQRHDRSSPSKQPLSTTPVIPSSDNTPSTENRIVGYDDNRNPVFSIQVQRDKLDSDNFTPTILIYDGMEVQALADCIAAAFLEAGEVAKRQNPSTQKQGRCAWVSTTSAQALRVVGLWEELPSGGGPLFHPLVQVVRSPHRYHAKRYLLAAPEAEVPSLQPLQAVAEPPGPEQQALLPALLEGVHTVRSQLALAMLVASSLQLIAPNTLARSICEPGHGGTEHAESRALVNHICPDRAPPPLYAGSLAAFLLAVVGMEITDFLRARLAPQHEGTQGFWSLDSPPGSRQGLACKQRIATLGLALVLFVLTPQGLDFCAQLARSFVTVVLDLLYLVDVGACAIVRAGGELARAMLSHPICDALYYYTSKLLPKVLQAIRDECELLYLHGPQLHGYGFWAIPDECPHGDECRPEELRAACLAMVLHGQDDKQASFWAKEATLKFCRSHIADQARNAVIKAERFLVLAVALTTVYQVLVALPGVVRYLPSHAHQVLGLGASYSDRGAKSRLYAMGVVFVPFVLKSGSHLGLGLLYRMPPGCHAAMGVFLAAWMLAIPWQVEQAVSRGWALVHSNMRTPHLLLALGVLGLACVGAIMVNVFEILWPLDALYGSRLHKS